MLTKLQQTEKKITELEGELKIQRALLRELQKKRKLTCAGCKKNLEMGQTALIRIMCWNNEAYCERWETSKYAVICPNCEAPSILTYDYENSAQFDEYSFAHVTDICLRYDYGNPTANEWETAKDVLRKKGYLKPKPKCKCDCGKCR